MSNRGKWLKPRDHSTLQYAPDGAVGIPLANGRGTAWVDAEDVERVFRRRWALLVLRSRFSERRYATNGRITMHRFILGLKTGDGIDTDHIDGDGLNNRRLNLRQATRSQNLRNSKRRPGVSRFKGVRRQHLSQPHPWIAGLSVEGRYLHLGGFASQEEAAMAFNVAARRHIGAFARLNRVEMG